MSETFYGLGELYEKACNKNKGQSDFYCCATSKRTTERCLDLSSEYVFCMCKTVKEKERETKKNVIKEYKLQAYLVKEALKNPDWLLPIENKKWVLLDAERNFAATDLAGLNTEGIGKRLDILAYEPETQTYIVLELKIERAFAKAKRELGMYTSAIRKHIASANNCYSVDAKNVQGYILWNAISWPPVETTQTRDNPWGIIEYNKEHLDDIGNIEFELLKEPS